MVFGEAQMPEKITKNRINEFKKMLKELGGSSGNKRLREALGWGEDFYWKVQGRLVKSAEIEPGRGKGGSVKLSTSDIPNDALPPAGQPSKVDVKNERSLYAPVRSAIESKWINQFGFDSFVVDETHSRGSHDTDGTFTRPDITVAGLRLYRFLHRRIEIVTFEIKPRGAVRVLGVLEAIAHREAAHRSYVMYAVSKTDFDASGESSRIVELAQKHGIGVIAAEVSSKVDSWEIIIDALRHEPDPARLDRFLGDLPLDSMKATIQKWQN